MKLNYTTEYVYDGGDGFSCNIEIETTFDVTPGRPASFEHPPEGPEINDLTVEVLHIEGVTDIGGYYGRMAKIIADVLWAYIGQGINTSLIQRVYDDVDEAMYDHA